MRTLLLFSLVSLATLICARPVAGEVSTHARSVALATDFVDGKMYSDSSTDNTPNSPVSETKAEIKIPVRPSIPGHGGAQGSGLDAYAFASAAVAKLNISLILSAEGAGGNGGGEFSFAISGTGDALTGWRDEFVVASPSVPPGHKMTVRAPLIIEGDSRGTATVSDPDPDRVLDIGSGGIADGRMDVYDFSGSLGQTTFVDTEDPSWGGLLGVIDPETFRLAFVHYEPFLNVNVQKTTGPITVILTEHTVTNGQPYRVGYDLHATGSVIAERDQIAQFSALYLHTLNWGGIESVRDATTGALITDWTVTSASGYDYSQPFVLPEPTSLEIVVIALCCAKNSRHARARSQ